MSLHDDDTLQHKVIPHKHEKIAKGEINIDIGHRLHVTGRSLQDLKLLKKSINNTLFPLIVKLL